MNKEEFIKLAINKLLNYFEHPENCNKWLYIKNPNFGYISPIEMFNRGKGQEVLDFIDGEVSRG